MKLKSHIAELQPYIPGKPISELKRELGITQVIKLASNENPLGPSPKAIEAIQSAAATVSAYPDANAFDLRTALGEKLAVPSSNIVVGNGSDELIHILGSLFLGDPGDEVVAAEPSFSRYYSCAELFRAKLHLVPLDAQYRHDLNAMRDAITDKTRLVFIANPNNPTGTVVDKESMDEFLQGLPDHVAVVLDEAYFEFGVKAPNFPNGIDYLREGRRVVVLRTFSKTYGLAGLRVGYAIAPSDVIDAFNRAREPFNVSAVAQAAALAALQDEAHLQRTIDLNFWAIDRLERLFAELGATVVPSFGNFVFADLHRPARPIFEALLHNGVIVRSGDQFGCPTCLRVSVGTPEELDVFEEALRRVWAMP